MIELRLHHAPIRDFLLYAPWLLPDKRRPPPVKSRDLFACMVHRLADCAPVGKYFKTKQCLISLHRAVVHRPGHADERFSDRPFFTICARSMTASLILGVSSSGNPLDPYQNLVTRSPLTLVAVSTKRSLSPASEKFWFCLGLLMALRASLYTILVN